MHCREAEEYIKKFNLKHSQYRAQIFYLSDIEEKYFGEIKQVTQNITAKIQSVNKGTILNINPAYKLENALIARYVYTPVVSLYRLYREAIEQNYPLFEKNIREYLGNRGVNKNMYTTLLDPEDRKNFFYYNNGITIICDQMSKILTHIDNNMQDMQASFEIKNPQIVNGCQTVNTIYEVLKNVDPAIVEKEYKDAFVMLKVLVIDKNDESESTLYKNIVRYNNSQSPIDEKTFVANTSIFIRLQEEFEKKGFLLLIKQSDKNTFSVKYKTATKLAKANRDRIQKFNLPETKKASDVYIPLEKLLQVINAFVSGGFVAYKKKSSMLKIDSKEYNTAIGFIKDGAVTIDMLLDLYLLYKCAEKAKKDSQDKRSPIPYYLIDAFAKYDCCNRDRELILPNLESAEKIAKTIKHYTVVLKAYCKQYEKKYDLDYGVMIKRDIDYNILDETHAVYSDND